MNQRLWRKRPAVAVSVSVAMGLGGMSLVVADTSLRGRTSTPAPVPVVQEAPDSATAVAAARRQNSPVRVADLVTETRMVHARPDGSMEAELAAVPVRVRQGGRWVPVDISLARRPDGSVGPKASATEVNFSGGGQGPMVRYGAESSRMELTWPDALPTPVLSGSTATYAEVYPGVDLVLRANHAGYTQHVVVKDRQAAAAVREIKLGMTTEGLEVTANGDGALVGNDKQGGAVFRAPPSLMWDSAPERKESKAAVTVGSGALVIVPDAKLLNDSGTTYPVTIDPAPTDLGKAAWGGVYEGNQDQEYYNTTADPNGWAQVGQCNWSNCDAVVGTARTYFKFDTRWLAGKYWLSSYFKTVAVYRPDCNGHNHGLFWMHGEYLPHINWRNQPGYNHIEWQTVYGARPCASFPGEHYVTFDTKGTISFGGWSSYFLAAGDENSSSGWRKFDPHRTILTVEYNTPPNKPTELSVSPWRAACANCLDTTYLGDDFVNLRARVTDPDGDQINPYWTVNGSAEHSGKVNSGDLPAYEVDLRGKADQTPIGWSVKTLDRHWSGEETGPSFVTDRVSPRKAPTVVGDVYPADNRWHGGVGVPGKFTFTPNFEQGELKDIDHYRYGWGPEASEKVDAAGLNAPASVLITPPGDGPRDLYVYAADRSGRLSPPTVYHIYVRAGSGPLAQWSFEGNAKDTAFLGFRDGTPSAEGTAFTPGAVGTAITLDDAARGHVSAPSVVNTTASFSVSAWVLLDDPTGARAIVSQSGTNFSGFNLWHRTDANGVSRWAFGMTNADGSEFGGADWLLSAEPAVAGVWTHVTGVFDAQARKMRLYVNGVRSAEMNRTVPGFNATGGVQIGRTTWQGQPGIDPFSGVIDEVAIWDRVLSDAEVRSAVSRDNVQIGHWRFDEPSGTTAANAVSGGASGVLTGGARFTTPGIIDGAVRLDGTDDAVTLPGPQLRTDRGFTVAAWVELDRQIPHDIGATIASQDGTFNSGFMLQYRRESPTSEVGRWCVLMPDTDTEVIGNTSMVFSEPIARPRQRAHVTAVYDSATRVLKLYVDGQLANQVTRTGGYHAPGAFVIGRSQWNRTPWDFFPGLIDEVRAYSRPLEPAEIQGLVSQNNVTEGQWKLDGSLADTSGKGRHGTKAETIGFTSGKTSSPDPADLALSLEGNGYVSAPKALDTSRSFSVSAWVRLDRVGGFPVMVSQDGANVSAFQLQATPDGHWGFVLFSHDRADGGDAHHRLAGPAVQTGIWTHLAAVHDAPARKIHLYVNGVLTGTGDAPATMWNHPTGQLQIGAAKWAGQRSDRFPGAIDDVSVYNRVLFAEEVRTQAGRDLSLVHHWSFDEPSGTNAGDSVGSRAAAISGGYQREVGRSGNALRFNGSSGAATTSKVDLRTDQSFSVSAWVHLGPVTCEDPYVGCRRDAVTIDSNQTSKFRLGHLIDDGDNLAGSWIFEMPEDDVSPAVARAAVSVAPGELGNWVHLVGVYDTPSKTIWLYVDAVRQKDGALDRSWQATGGVAIGRGKAAGNAANHFPGMVDDVRLYAGVLDKGRVAALRASYPSEAATAPVPTDAIGYWKLDETTGTAGADSSGSNRPVAMTGGTGWIGGRKHGAMKLDGTTAWAQTAGPVIDTTRSFSVAVWTYLEGADTHNRTLVAQDGNRVSTFLLQYQRSSGRWAVLMPTSDADNPDMVVLASTEAAPVSDWTHLAVTYHSGLRQLALYVNGVLSAMRADVASLPSTGPLTLGRAKWNGANADFYRFCIDDVQVFNRVLSAGEVRAIHDDVYAADFGHYLFDDDTASDRSWRGNHATAHTSGVSYGPGVSGRALVLDGQSGRAATTWLGVSTRDSFTVSAWAKLSRKDGIGTVLSQDGSRASSFFLQYRPGPDRWVFGHFLQDEDASGVQFAQSLRAPEVGRWTHLTGVYDYAARQLRLYIDGHLSGTRENVTLWAGNRGFAIGRDRDSGVFGDFFPGSIDGVQVFQGIRNATDISRMGWPATPEGVGQLGRFVDSSGDHYAVADGQSGATGYHFEVSLGALVTGERPNTRMLYSCVSGTDRFTSTDAACEGATAAGEVGRVYTQQPSNVLTVALHRCLSGQERFESRSATCEGKVHDRLLGYTLAYASMGRYYSAGEHWQGVSVGPFGSRYEGPLGWVPVLPQPGAVPLNMCYDGRDQFLSTDANCAGKTVAGLIGYIHPSAPSGVDSKALYSCRYNGERFADHSPTCGGHTVDGLLGYVFYGPINLVPVFS